MGMGEQLAFEGIREPTVPTRANQLDHAAREYLAENPGFWRLFCRFADQLWNAGRRGGAKLICERIRWETRITGGHPYKVNNSLVSSFARIYTATFPERRSLFETRAEQGETGPNDMISRTIDVDGQVFFFDRIYQEGDTWLVPVHRDGMGCTVLRYNTRSGMFDDVPDEAMRWPSEAFELIGDAIDEIRRDAQGKGLPDDDENRMDARPRQEG